LLRVENFRVIWDRLNDISFWLPRTIPFNFISLYSKNAHLVQFSKKSIRIYETPTLQIESMSFFFGFHHLFNLVRGGQFWYQVVPAPSRSQLQGIEPWTSLPNSAPITTELTDDWYWKHVLRHNTNAYSITSILSNYYQSHVRCSCVCLCQCCIDYDSHAKS
jgi:hypothetical protein